MIKREDILLLSSQCTSIKDTPCDDTNPPNRGVHLLIICLYYPMSCCSGHLEFPINTNCVQDHPLVFQVQFVLKYFICFCIYDCMLN